MWGVQDSEEMSGSKSGKKLAAEEGSDHHRVA
jgi:hypothetical protein